MKNEKEFWPVQNSSISAGWKTEVVVESGSANWAERKARILEKEIHIKILEGAIKQLLHTKTKTEVLHLSQYVN